MRANKCHEWHSSFLMSKVWKIWEAFKLKIPRWFRPPWNFAVARRSPNNTFRIAESLHWSKDSQCPHYLGKFGGFSFGRESIWVSCKIWNTFGWEITHQNLCGWWNGLDETLSPIHCFSGPCNREAECSLTKTWQKTSLRRIHAAIPEVRITITSVLIW